MKQQGPINTVSIIGLGAIGCFFAGKSQRSDEGWKCLV